MSAIFGIFRLNGRPVDRGTLERMVTILRHRGPDAQGVWCENGVGLGHTLLWTTPESMREEQPLTGFDKKLVLTADARIDNREELIRDLGLPMSKAQGPTDADLILAAYRRWGECCAERLTGDFAFAIWDRDRGRLFCARDHIGVKSLFYYHNDKRLFVFATEIKGLFEVGEIPRQLNESRVADYLAFITDDLETTFFRNVKRLPPGHCVTVSLDGLKMRRYWEFDPDREVTLESDADYEAAFRELFTEAVRCRLRSAFPPGATLSGGLDSSSITCSAREILRTESERKLHTFSAIFPGLPDKDLRRIDERAYMETVIEGGDLIAHRIRADELNPLGDLETVLWHQDEPHVPFNLYMHLGMYRCARSQGVRVLLDGFDGDTTVSHGYERLPELAKTLHWITLLKETSALRYLYANPGLATWWRIIRAHALTPLIPPWVGRVLESMRHPTSSPLETHSVISKSFARRTDLEERVRTHAVRNDPPFQGARHAHLRGLSSPLLPYALELVDKAAAASGLEARYPFFDHRLMAFCLAVPADQKLRRGWTRSLFRRSMRGLLPAKIQWRPNKGDLSPNFRRGLLRFGLDPVRTILREDRGAIGNYIDMAALRATYDRYRAKPSDSDGMTLFAVVTLWYWLRRNDIEGIV